MITLLGTGHVFDLRMRVTEEIVRRMPDVVALELDAPRYRSLLAPPETPRDAPAAYRAVASLQERIASAYGVRAGDEMRAADAIAKDLRVPIALIDVDARTTFERLRREMPFWEKARLLGATVGGFLMPSRGIEAQVDQLASDYSGAFAEMAVKFPTMKRLLIDERNVYMAKALVHLHGKHPRVVAVVGDGHVDGLLSILEGSEAPVEAVRLREMRKSSAQPTGTATAAFSVDWRA